MKSRLYIAVAALLCSAFAAHALDQSSLSLHLHLTGLREAAAPHIVDDYLVLSATGPYRFVGAAFSHEDWRTIYPFERNRYGVFVLALPVPYGEARAVSYRLVLDGAWAADPANPLRARDESTGAALSIAELPLRSRLVLGAWDPASKGMANFVFLGESGQRVSVAGSFNSWDPFIHEMEESAPGRYELSLPLPPGAYYYVFVYKGERLADPLNRKLMYGSDGRPVSELVIARN